MYRFNRIFLYILAATIAVGPFITAFASYAARKGQEAQAFKDVQFAQMQRFDFALRSAKEGSKLALKEFDAGSVEDLEKRFKEAEKQFDTDSTTALKEMEDNTTSFVYYVLGQILFSMVLLVVLFRQLKKQDKQLAEERAVEAKLEIEPQSE